jgi:hypothetical protein
LPNPAATIRARFGAVAAFADHRQSAFIAAMDADPLARRGFADATGIVYVLQSGEGLPKAEQVEPRMTRMARIQKQRNLPLRSGSVSSVLSVVNWLAGQGP